MTEAFHLDLTRLDGDRQSLLRFLNIRSAMNPILSADGRIDFLSDVTGSFQLWYIDRADPWAQQLTFGPERVQSADRSPDGQWIIYGTDVGGNERSQLHLLSPHATIDRDLTRRPDAFHTFGCWAPDSRRIAFASNRRAPAFFDVWVLEIESGEQTLVMDGESYYQPMAFSPDGGRLLVWELQGSFANALFELDLATGARRRLTPEHDPRGTRYQRCHYTRDGRSLLLLSDRDREILNLARMDLATGALTWLTDEAWDVEALEVSRDERRLAVLVNEDGVHRMRVWDLNGDALTPVPVPPLPGDGGVAGLSLSRDADRIALSFHSPRHAPDVWLLDIAASTLTQRTFSSRAGIALERLPPPTIERFESFDGWRIPGNLYIPEHTPEQRGTLPVVIHVHGGPESQARVGFRWLVSYLLERGYGVFTPNVRGSTGYGRTFSALDDTTRRLDSVKDLVSAATWLKGLGVFDPAKVVVMGGSYGGYMTLAALSMFPEHWAAGIDIVGIANLRSFIANTGSYRRRWRMQEYGDPSVIPEFMEAASPLNHAHHIRAPLMVIHGANDPRVPQSEADQIVAAVKGRGGDVEYLLYPDEGHGINKLENRIHCYTRVVDFLDRHLLTRSAP